MVPGYGQHLLTPDLLRRSSVGAEDLRPRSDYKKRVINNADYS